eukprot:50960_1
MEFIIHDDYKQTWNLSKQKMNDHNNNNVVILPTNKIGMNGNIKGNINKHNCGIMEHFYKNINNNKQEVNNIINTINKNMENSLSLTSGNIKLYENQMKINNKNTE